VLETVPDIFITTRKLVCMLFVQALYYFILFIETVFIPVSVRSLFVFGGGGGKSSISA
jgi:hypothetical protein